jgi:tetratricopeptide (TPR) repeat protein
LLGCGPTKKQIKADHAVRAYMAGDFEVAAEKLRKLSDDKNEDFVLNNCRLGSTALAQYHLDEAQAAFLRAYEVINSVGVNDGGRSLGAVLVDEKIKVWKGEPFERAMANFYLGLIYYIQRDYNNARAAFENALFKLRDNTTDKDEQHDYAMQESNFVLATIMLGKCWTHLGRDDLAQANFDRARQLRPNLDELANLQVNRESNVLLVVDFGYGPRKATEFDGSIVGFKPTPDEAGMIPRPRVIVDGSVIPLGERDIPTIDLLAMAQDRRWQSIDTLRAIKSAVGTGLILAGTYEGIRGLEGEGSAQRRDLTAAAILLGSGLLLKATSQADIRQWEMLPRTTFVIPLKLPPGTHDVTIDFPDVHALRQQILGLEAPSSGENTCYIRMQRYRNEPIHWMAEPDLTADRLNMPQ